MKIGDKVRRKPENQEDYWWLDRCKYYSIKVNAILTIKTIRDITLKFMETNDANCSKDAFELVKTSYFIY